MKPTTINCLLIGIVLSTTTAFIDKNPQTVQIHISTPPANYLSSGRQDFFAQVEMLIERGKQQGTDYLSSKNEKTKRSAKTNLDDAEEMLKKKLKQEPQCEKCFELLTITHFQQAYFGFAKNYEDCLKVAEKGISSFPANSRLPYYKGYAHYNSAQYSESVKSFQRFLMSPSDTQTISQVRQIIQTSQQLFLGSWNRHASYYQSLDSKITAYNQQTYKQDVIFQVTPDWEMGLGNQGFAAITSQAAKLEDAELKTYVENLVERLTGKSPGSPFTYKVTIVNSPEVNAVTPPGHIIVYTGLLAAAENESELAGVLAHELAHNYAHHQARAVLQKYHLQTAANAVINLANPQTAAAQLTANLAASITVDLFVRAYSRFEEKEADLYGSHILFNSGYNPTASSNFFLKMYKANPKRQIRFLSTHPPAPDRASYLTDYLESFPLDREMQIDSREFQKMKSKLSILVPAQTQQSDQGRGIMPAK